MIPSQHLEADLRDSLALLAATPLAELLLQHGILRRLAADHLRRRLRDTVVFSAEEEPLVIARLWQGLATIPPTSLAPGWIEALEPMVQGPIRERWDQIRLQKWMEEAYRERVEPYFLERRDDLEQVVYGMIRVRNQGAAEELYLRLLDDQADFGDLARVHSLGEERFSRGLVGPMLISQPHPTIRAVLQKLAVGDLHPPFRVDNWVLLVRMEHRQPAQLNDTTLLQLSQELLQKDLEAALDEQLAALYPGLLAAFPPPPASSGQGAAESVGALPSDAMVAATAVSSATAASTAPAVATATAAPAASAVTNGPAVPTAAAGTAVTGATAVAGATAVTGATAVAETGAGAAAAHGAIPPPAATAAAAQEEAPSGAGATTQSPPLATLPAASSPVITAPASPAPSAANPPRDTPAGPLASAGPAAAMPPPVAAAGGTSRAGGPTVGQSPAAAASAPITPAAPLPAPAAEPEPPPTPEPPPGHRPAPGSEPPAGA